MPFVQVTTSVPVAPQGSRDLLGELSRLVARELGKPEAYVMTHLVAGQTMSFAGTEEPTCYVELKNIGRFTPEQTERLSATLGAYLEGALGVPRRRTYVEFADAEGYLWGHDGGTFA